MNVLKLCKGPLCNGIEKDTSEFSPKSSQCKKCICHTTKEYYKLHDRPYRKYKNEIKENSKCTLCGCNDINLLDFDHLGTKNVAIAKSFSKKQIKTELQYTQILCVWCHRLKSRQQMDELMNMKSFVTEDRPTDTIVGKVCNGPICKGKLQFLTNFHNVNSNRMCKICISWRLRQNRLINYEYLKNLKLQDKECLHCKIQVTPETICCFDYDHIDPKNKTCNLSVYVRNNYDVRQKMLEEIKKCRLLCCKCHRIHTANQLDYKYARVQNEHSIQVG